MALSSLTRADAILCVRGMILMKCGFARTSSAITAFLPMINWKKFFSKKLKIILTTVSRCDTKQTGLSPLKYKYSSSIIVSFSSYTFYTLSYTFTLVPTPNPDFILYLRKVKFNPRSTPSLKITSVNSTKSA